MSKRCRESVVVEVMLGQVAVATMFRGTDDSSFVLQRGVPGNGNGRIEDYFWTDVYKNGEPVTLKAKMDNPLVIDGNVTPGSYRFRNEGTDDEDAIIDLTVYKNKS